MIYYLKDYVMEGNHAGSKAVADCEQILKDSNYNELDLKIGKFMYYYGGFFTRQTNMRKLKKGDIAIVQYPQHGKKNKSMTRNFKFLKNRGIKLIAIIHDIKSLRERESEKEIKCEIDALNAFSVVVSHNSSMTKWLKEKGYKNKVVNLGIFDYLGIDKLNKNIEDENFKHIYFAGNLEEGKSGFLYTSELVNLKLPLQLFGPNYRQDIIKGNIDYKGNFSPNELSRNFKEGFGLIWDGNSIYKCNGNCGEYLRFNNPHKASLYIGSGLPIIVWKKSAIVDFVLDNKIGFVIESLDEIQSYLENITKQQYEELKRNVLRVQKKIVHGDFMKEALTKAIKVANSDLKKQEASAL